PNAPIAPSCVAKSRAVQRPAVGIQKRWTAAHREDSTNETTGLSQGGGCRDDGVRGCRSGHRPVDARVAMAADGELAEIARHALWRCRTHGQAGCRAERE